MVIQTRSQRRGQVPSQTVLFSKTPAFTLGGGSPVKPTYCDSGEESRVSKRDHVKQGISKECGAVKILCDEYRGIAAADVQRIYAKCSKRKRHDGNMHKARAHLAGILRKRCEHAVPFKVFDRACLVPELSTHAMKQELFQEAHKDGDKKERESTRLHRLAADASKRGEIMKKCRYKDEALLREAEAEASHLRAAFDIFRRANPEFPEKSNHIDLHMQRGCNGEALKVLKKAVATWFQHATRKGKEMLVEIYFGAGIHSHGPPKLEGIVTKWLGTQQNLRKTRDIVNGKDYLLVGYCVDESCESPSFQK